MLYEVITGEPILQNQPAIIAVGRTKFGEYYGKEPEKLIEEAWLAASNGCCIERKDLVITSYSIHYTKLYDLLHVCHAHNIYSRYQKANRAS